MYYNGYSYGYSNSNPCCGGSYGYPMYGYYGGGYGYSGAIILVLFILLVVAFGAGFLNQNGNN